LIEVLVALAVLAVGLTALLTSHGNSVKNNVTIAVIYKGTMLAHEKIADLEVNSYELEEPDELEFDVDDYTYGRLHEEGEFENESDDDLLDWREDYLWEVYIDETDLEGIGKLTVSVYNERFEERIPPITIVTWIPYEGFVDEDDEDDVLFPH